MNTFLLIIGALITVISAVFMFGLVGLFLFIGILLMIISTLPSGSREEVEKEILEEVKEGTNNTS